VGNLLDQTFGSELAEIVAQRGEVVVSGGATQGLGGLGVQFCGGKGAFGGDVGEAQQSVHQGQLPRVIELQAGNPFAVGQDRGLAELVKLAAIDEGFENVLLNVEVVVDDRGKLLPELGKLVDGFVDGVVVNVVGGRLGAEQEMIADVLFDEAMAIVTANDGIG